MTKVKSFSGRIMRDVSKEINDWLSEEPVTVEFVNQAYKQNDMEWNILIFYREVAQDQIKKAATTTKKTTKVTKEQSNDEVK